VSDHQNRARATLHRIGWQQSPEYADAFSNAILELLTQRRDLTRQELTRRTSWRVLDLWKREHREVEVPYSVSVVNEDGEEKDFFDTRQSVAPSPEAQYFAAEPIRIILALASPHQRQICDLILLGYSLPEVAHQLRISRWTLRQHLKELERKTLPFLTSGSVLQVRG
jgi:hypothetical protein